MVADASAVNAAEGATPEARIGGRYRVLGVLGRGASGTVYDVRRDELERRYALKLLDGSAGSPERYEREARALGQIRHPHVVDVVDFGREPDGRVFVVVEHLEGRTLAEALRAGVDRQQALEWLTQIAAAVDHAHAHGILHRDLKPENVMLVRGPDGRENVKVLDFGLARLLDREQPAMPATQPDQRTRDPRLTRSDTLVGTPRYAAPEAILGPEGGRSADVYSFGVMAYELLASRAPFEGTLAEVLAGHLEREPPDPAAWNRRLPDAAWAALRSALSKDPRQRPESAGTLAEALRRAYASVEHEQRERRQRQRLRVAGAILLVALLALSGPFARWPGLEPLERQARDRLLATLPARAPAPELLLVSIDEESLRRDARPLAQQADELATGIEELLAAGARGVAIDLLLPESFAASARFTELLIRRNGSLTLAAFSTPDGHVLGPEALPLAARAELGEQRAAGLFGFVNVDREADGMVRSLRPRLTDERGMARASWAWSAALLARGDTAALPRLWLDARVDPERLPRIPWFRLRDELHEDPSQFRGALVLLGAEYASNGDVHRVVAHGRAVSVSGLALQALLVDALLSQRHIAELDPRPWLYGCALACVVPLLLPGLIPGVGRSLLSAALLGALAFVLPALLLVRAGQLAPLGRVAALFLLGTLWAVLVRFWICRRP